MIRSQIKWPIPGRDGHAFFRAPRRFWGLGETLEYRASIAKRFTPFNRWTQAELNIAGRKAAALHKSLIVE